MATATETDVTAGIEWDAAPARTLTDDSMLHEFFDREEITTVGDVDGWLSGLDSLPAGFTSKQIRELVDAVNKAGEEYSGPVVLKWLEPANPSTEPTEEEAERLREYDASTLAKINEMTKAAGEREYEWEQLHKRASAAKKQFELATEQLMAYIRVRQEDRTPNDLFSKKPDDADTKPAGQVPEDLWKQYPLTFENFGRFGLTEKDIERLNSGDTKNHGTHPIQTVGDMTRFITPNESNPSYARTLTYFKGFGEKGVERWQEAESQFWAWWNNGGDVEFAREKGLLVQAENQPEYAPADAQPVEEPTLDNIDGGDVNPLPDADTKPKRKRGGR